MDTQNSTKKYIIASSIIGVLLLLAIIIGIISTSNYNSTHSASLRFFIQPSDATILLDNEPIDTSSGIIKTTPGDHSIAIIRSGFFPEGEEFSLEPGESYDIVYSLSPFSDEAKRLLKQLEN